MPVRNLSIVQSPRYWYRTLRRMEAAGRDHLIGHAARVAAPAWVRDAIDAGDYELLGLFELWYGGDPDARIPAIMLRTRRRALRPGQPDDVRIVRIWYDDAGQLNVDSKPAEQPPWARYRGDRDGAPSLFNGDEPPLSGPR